MSDVTLVEFLTARLGEDEAWTRRSTHLMAASDTPAGTTRVLREVEAKRAIVARCEADSDDPSRGTSYDLALEVMADLAAVYADHHDYDPDWRV